MQVRSYTNLVCIVYNSYTVSKWRVWSLCNLEYGVVPHYFCNIFVHQHFLGWETVCLTAGLQLDFDSARWLEKELQKKFLDLPEGNRMWVIPGAGSGRDTGSSTIHHVCLTFRQVG